MKTLVKNRAIEMVLFLFSFYILYLIVGLAAAIWVIGIATFLGVILELFMDTGYKKLSPIIVASILKAANTILIIGLLTYTGPEKSSIVLLVTIPFSFGWGITIYDIKNKEIKIGWIIISYLSWYVLFYYGMHFIQNWILPTIPIV